MHLNEGRYIMAGGGFQVCGNVTLDAPHVMIYNTNDPTAPLATYGKVGQIMLNTTGTVTLGPETRVKDPLYAGFTIFQDRSQVVDPPTFTPTNYTPVPTLAAAVTSTASTFDVNGNPSAIYPGNVISVGTELMIVTSVKPNGANSTIAVNRGYNGTTPAAYTAGTAVKSVTYGGDKCDNKGNTALGGDHSDMDISFVGAGSVSGHDPLDFVSGTIYAAGPRADFENALFGSANLAVLASCIFIDSGDVPGATSDFSFIPDNNNFAGIGVSLAE